MNVCRGDLGPKIGYEAVGLVDAGLQTVGVWGTDGARVCLVSCDVYCGLF